MHIEAQIVAFMAVTVLVAYFAARVRVPYAIAMVAAGLGIAVLNFAPVELTSFDLEPRLIFLAFLPGLLFEASFQIDLRLFREYLRPILLLAIPGVLLSTLLTGLLINLEIDLPFREALLFGALISATDPVAVIALFRQLGVDRRLEIIVEGESLFNDGVAIILYGVLVGAAAGGSDFSLGETTVSMLVSIAGGAALGAAAGALFALLMARTDDRLLNLALTTILAYGTYILAEDLLQERVSPVIAVVVAGIVAGNYHPPGAGFAVSAATIAIFWEFVVFVINSAVFLLIGLEVDILSLLATLRPIALAIVIVLAVRAAVIYLLRLLVGRLPSGPKIPLRWAHVIYWSGLRGAVTVALALSLPFAIESRGLLINMTFGYVLFSLIVQGLTAPLLLRRLGLTRRSDVERQFEAALAEMATAQASFAAINRLQQDGILPPESADILRRQFDETIGEQQRQINALIASEPGLIKSSAGAVRRELLYSQREALNRLLRRGLISEEVYSDAIRALDEQASESPSAAWMPAEPPSGSTQPLE